MNGVRSLVLTGSLLVMTACGTTVPQGARPTALNALQPVPSPASPTGPELAASADAPSAGLSEQSASQRSTATAATANGRRPVTPGLRSTALTPSTHGSSTSPTSATAPVKVGVFTFSNTGALASAAGAHASGDDPQTTAQAIITYVNAHGGLAGHPITPVFAEVDLVSSQDVDTQYEAACSTFTEDNDVVAVVAASPFSEAFAACLAQKGKPLVAGASDAERSGLLSDNPGLFLPGSATLERAFETMTDGLLQQRWIDGRWSASSTCATVTKPRVGIITLSSPGYSDLPAQLIVPRLTKAGYTDTEVIAIDQDGGDAADIVAKVGQQTQSAVLKFQSDCVDHVMFTTNSNLVPMVFAESADSQQYTPRYGFYSSVGPGRLVASVPDAKSQLKGALGVGWQPYNDVDASQLDAAAKAPQATCFAILTQAGLSTTGSSAWPDVEMCDALLLLPAALHRGAPLSRSAITSAVEALGSRYQSSLALSASFSSARHDGAASWRPLAFQDACGCFAYTGAAQPF